MRTFKLELTQHEEPLPLTWLVAKFGGSCVEEITISRQRQPEGPDKFAVRTASKICINREIESEYEPLPSNRTDEFYERCRFDTFEEALDIARKATAKLRAELQGQLDLINAKGEETSP